MKINFIMIPVIHRVWIGDFPEKNYCSKFIKSVNDCFDGFVPVFWRDDTAETFIKDVYPEWYKYLYESNLCPKVVVSDIVRYLLLQKYGGIYTDLDLEVINPTLQGMIRNKPFVVFVEVELNEKVMEATKSIPLRNGIPEDVRRIASYFFYSEPNHPIWKKIIDEMKRRLKQKNTFEEDYDELYLTGPDLITTVVNKYEKSLGLTVLTKKQSDECIKHHFYGEKTWKSLLKKNPYDL